MVEMQVYILILNLMGIGVNLKGDSMSFFEMFMIICFGLAWPLSIIKTIKSKSTKGKSLFFLLIVFLGYLSGITHKILYSFDFVIIFYILNAVMVLIDIILYLYCSRVQE